MKDGHPIAIEGPSATREGHPSSPLTAIIRSTPTKSIIVVLVVVVEVVVAVEEFVVEETEGGVEAVVAAAVILVLALEIVVAYST